MTALAVSNIVLWVIVLTLLVVVLALTRQLGVLHERIAPVGALMVGRGLTVGDQAPVVGVTAACHQVESQGGAGLARHHPG